MGLVNADALVTNAIEIFSEIDFLPRSDFIS